MPKVNATAGGETPVLNDEERQIVKAGAAYVLRFCIFGMDGKDDKTLLPDEVEGAKSAHALPATHASAFVLDQAMSNRHNNSAISEGTAAMRNLMDGIVSSEGRSSCDVPIRDMCEPASLFRRVDRLLKCFRGYAASHGIFMYWC